VSTSRLAGEFFPSPSPPAAQKLVVGRIGHIGFAIIEPLAELYGLEKVEIKGYVRPELKNKLIYVMTRNERREIPTSNMIDRRRRRKRVRLEDMDRLEDMERLELDWETVKES
jgi:hypothetical protein